MSAIGTYVHYNRENYLTHGINYPNTGAVNISATSLNELTNEYSNLFRVRKNTLNKAEIKKMQKQLNDYLKSMQTSDSKIFNNLKQAAIDKFGKDLGETLENTLTSNYNKSGISKVKAIRTSEGNKLNAQEILTKVEKLDKEFITDVLLASKPKDVSIEIKQYREELQKLIDKIKISESDIYANLNSKEVTECRKLINTLIEMSGAAISPKNLLTGWAFEEFISQAFEGLTKDTVVKVIGEEFEKAKLYDLNRFGIYGNISGTGYDENLHLLEGNAELYTSTDRQRSKIDISLKSNNKNINISAKNYNISDDKNYAWIHTVSGAPLLRMLQFFPNDVITHYMNITANHLNYRFRTFIGNIKKGIFYESLTGDTWGSNKNSLANVFILFDNNKQEFYIINMSDIISKLDILEKNSGISVKINDVNIKRWTLSNDYYDNKKGPNLEGAKHRIAGLLSQMHQAKVKCSFNFKTFKNLIDNN